jgi:hypothetical protein
MSRRFGRRNIQPVMYVAVYTRYDFKIDGCLSINGCLMPSSVAPYHLRAYEGRPLFASTVSGRH